MQHFILHCGALEQTRHSFINEIRELVGSVNNEKLLGLILDPSTAGVHEENRDSYWESRHVYFRLSHIVNFITCFTKNSNNLLSYPGRYGS